MSGAPPARRPPPPGRWADPDLADGRAWSPTKPRSNYTIDLDSSRAIIPVIGNPRITYYVLLHPPILLTYPKSLSNPSTPESRHKGKQCKKSLHKQARKISSSGTILSPRSLGLARIRKTIQSPELPPRIFLYYVRWGRRGHPCCESPTGHACNEGSIHGECTTPQRTVRLSLDQGLLRAGNRV